MVAHIPKMDENFPIPKPIDPKKLKDFTSPFLIKMRVYYEDLKKSVDAANKR